MRFDLPLEQLRSYRPPLRLPADLDAFWRTTLDEARQRPLAAEYRPVDLGLVAMAAYDVRFAGFGGDEVRGWLLLPERGRGHQPTACVVQFVGYGGGRGHPTDWLYWPSVGLATLVMDSRGQGSVWSRGATADDGSSGPQAPGFLTRGVLDPRSYYYRRLFTDAVRAVDAARSHPAIDPARVATAGHSQGGGLALAAAALAERVWAVLADAPFLCHVRRAVEVTDALPYQELVTYLAVHRGSEERVFATLDYFDVMHLAPRVTAPALLSTALMDTVCPPSTVFAAYHHLAGPKDLRVYPFNQHQPGDGEHRQAQRAFLQGLPPAP